LLPLKKYGVEVSPIMLMIRTKKLNELFKKLAARSPKSWRVFADISIIVAIGEMFLAYYILADNLFSFLFMPQQAQPVIPVLPGITINLRWLPYFLISASIAFTIHELAHGIIGTLEKIAIKSSGIILSPLTFGGFVEQDEENFNNAGLRSKLRIISVGSLTNLAAGLLALLLLNTLFIPASGVIVMGVTDEGAASKAGILPWDVIKSINNVRINNLYELNLHKPSIKPGDYLAIEIERGGEKLVYDIINDINPFNSSQGIIGVEGLTSYYPLRINESLVQFSYHLNILLNWISFLMVNLSIFNMMVLYPLDGEAYVYNILKEKIKNESLLKRVRVTISVISLFLVILNIGFTLFRFGLIQI
jgi:membrane-associated protease RseP (regulator of RpoE activity)